MKHECFRCHVCIDVIYKLSVISMHCGKLDGCYPGGVTIRKSCVTIRCPIVIIYEHPLYIISVVQPSFMKIHQVSFVDPKWGDKICEYCK
jgi:hypothetical protein